MGIKTSPEDFYGEVDLLSTIKVGSKFVGTVEITLEPPQAPGAPLFPVEHNESLVVDCF